MTGADVHEHRPVLYLYRLKPGAGPEYDRRHGEVWPEMRALLDEAGIYDYCIWRHDEIVVCHMQVRHGLAHMRAVTGASDVQARWTQSLADLFEQTADGDGEPLWLAPVFTHRVASDEGAP